MSVTKINKAKKIKIEKKPKGPKLKTRYIGKMEIEGRKFETNEFFKNEKAALKAVLKKAIEYGYIKAEPIKVKVKVIEERVRESAPAPMAIEAAGK